MGRRPFTQQQCCIINRGHMPKSLLIPLIRDEIGFVWSKAIWDELNQLQILQIYARITDKNINY